MADVSYDVAYVARVPASLKQDEFAAMVDELCNGRAEGGWRLVSAVGDYGAKVTLGMWLIFAGEGPRTPSRPLAETDAGVDLAPAAGLDEDSGESAEPAGVEPEESP